MVWPPSTRAPAPPAVKLFAACCAAAANCCALIRHTCAPTSPPLRALALHRLGSNRAYRLSRCRTLYEKYLEWSPANCHAWIKFAELESTLGEAQRARAIYELAIMQPVLDMPEALWKVRSGGEGGGRRGRWGAGW